MIRFLYRSTQFDVCLNALRRAGGTAGIAARKADAIIDKLVFEGCNNSTERGYDQNHLEKETVSAGSVNNTSYLNSPGFENIEYEIFANNQHSVPEFL